MMTGPALGPPEASAVGAAAMLPFIKVGKVRCIATGSAKRLPQLPGRAHCGPSKGAFSLALK